MKSTYFFIYNVLLFIFLPFFIIGMIFFYLIKDKKSAGFFNKLFYYNRYKSFKTGGIWVHAVSIGEVNASVNFIRLISKKVKKPIYISVVTKTGYEYAYKHLEGTAADVFYFPYDFLFSVKRVVNLIKPSCFISIETEIWPNLFNVMKKLRIPVCILNARISGKSYKNYILLNFFFKYIFENIDLAACISLNYYDKLLKLGVKKENLFVTGNMKFDSVSFTEIEKLKKEMEVYKKWIHENTGYGNKILIAGSTHEGEEKIILDIFLKLNLTLIIAPRHPERFKFVEDLISTYKIPYAKLSSTIGMADATCKTALNGFADLKTAFREQRNGSIPSLQAAQPGVHDFKTDSILKNKKIILVDKIGILTALYSLSDVAFIGGSMVNAGGHNPLEPLLFGKPVVFGTFVENFKEITEEIVSNNAGIMANNPDELYNAVFSYLYNEDKYRTAGINGQKLIEANRGSSMKNMQLVLNIINQKI